MRAIESTVPTISVCIGEIESPVASKTSKPSTKDERLLSSEHGLRLGVRAEALMWDKVQTPGPEI